MLHLARTTIAIAFIGCVFRSGWLMGNGGAWHISRIDGKSWSDPSGYQDTSVGSAGYAIISIASGMSDLCSKAHVANSRRWKTNGRSALK